MIKILFYLPSILLTLVSNIVPFNPKRYKPSSETERELSQSIRNKSRLTAYYAKRIITPR